MPKPNTPPAKRNADKPGLQGWIEVFKAGTHTDSSGRKITFNQADLDQMVENHKLGAAPAVLGHPRHDDPAYAWTEGLKREGDSLFAKFTDINPSFEEGVKAGAYRNRSVSVFKDDAAGWRVRHVGWLGAKAPAIDGLKPVEFACDEENSHEFAAPGYSLVWGLESIAKLLRGLREQMIAKDGIEAADQVLPQWQIDSAIEAAAQARQEFQEARESASYSQHNTGGSMFTQADIDKAKEEATAQAAAQLAERDAQLRQFKANERKTRIVTAIEGWKGAGLVTPAEEAGLVEFMSALEEGDAKEFAFSAADKTEVKKTPAQFFADFMAGRKPVVKLANNGNDDTQPASIDVKDATALGKAASEFMAAEEKAGRFVSAAAAVEHVIKQQKAA